MAEQNEQAVLPPNVSPVALLQEIIARNPELREQLLVPSTVAICLAVLLTLVVWCWPWQPAVFLERRRKKALILDIREVSPDTKVFRISTGSRTAKLGLPTGKHVTLYAPNPQRCLETGTWNGRPDPDKGRKEILRTYTPITSNDVVGHFDLMIKCYSPGTVALPDGREVDWPDGGKMTSYLASKKPGDYIEISGPIGLHEYIGQGVFKAPGGLRQTDHICMLAGGAGITPMLQIIRHSLNDPYDNSMLTLLYANKTEDDILARSLLEELATEHDCRLQVHFTLDYPPDGWEGERGHISAEMISKFFVLPTEAPLFLMCGPPAMIEFACKKSLEELRYPKDMWLPL